MVKQNRHSSGIGGSLILIIFIVLTLTVFSVLTLASARNELSMVTRTAKSSTDYYAAEKEAAIKCGELIKLLDGVTDRQEILNIAAENGAEAEDMGNIDAVGATAISFTVDIDGNRSLKTVILSDNGKMSVTAQQIVNSSSDIIIDDELNLWDGSSPFPG